MSRVKSRRDVATHTVHGRQFRVERIAWRDTDGLSFDVYDVATGVCLTQESFDEEPGQVDIAMLIDTLARDVAENMLDPLWDSPELRAVLACREESQS